MLFDDVCRDQVDLAVEHWRPQYLNPLHETVAMSVPRARRRPPTQACRAVGSDPILPQESVSWA